MILEICDLTKSFGALRACDGVTLGLEPGECHAVIGPNGAGKTTLVDQIGGQQRPDGGRILFDGHDLTHEAASDRPRYGLVRSFQITSVFGEFTVLENVALATQLRLSHSFRFLAPAARDRRLTDPARAIIARVGLEAVADLPAATIAHGQQRRLELAMAMALQPRLMVLDEPLAGMGLEESAAMVTLLASLKGQMTLLLVEHDMDAVFALADRISVLVYGRVIATGVPEEIRANQAVRVAYLGED